MSAVLGKDKSVKEELMALFSVSPMPMSAHKQVWERVRASLEDFLSGQNVSTNSELQPLPAHFHNSKSPDEVIPVESYIEYLEQSIIPHAMNMFSPRCIGHMASVLPNFTWGLGELVIALNQNLVKRQASKSFTLLERQTLGMVHRIIYDLPDQFYNEHIQKETSTLGIMASGGTLANITALWIARNACFGPAGEFAGIEEEGFSAALDHYGYKGAVVIGSSLMHYSIQKAAGILGLGTRNVIRVPVDQSNHIDLRTLRKTVDDCVSRRQRIIAIIATAGTTDCGSIDHLAHIADVAEEANVHFHVDAAWGAPLLLSRTHRHKLAGVERADSVTVDGHKQMYLPLGNSMLLLRNPHAAKVIEKQAPYMLQEGSGDLGKCSLEGSRPASALFMHAALHVIGRQGYEFLVDENIRRAKDMANSIRRRTEFELLLEPETNILLYRYIPEKWRTALAHDGVTHLDNEQINLSNTEIQKAQYEAGRTFVSRTTMEKACGDVRVPVVALRAVMGNPFTSELDIETVLEDQIRIGTELDLSIRNRIGR